MIHGGVGFWFLVLRLLRAAGDENEVFPVQ
jgi:hypothetical protein